jgi:hypothetical protein
MTTGLCNLWHRIPSPIWRSTVFILKNRNRIKLICKLRVRWSLLRMCKCYGRARADQPFSYIWVNFNTTDITKISGSFHNAIILDRDSDLLRAGTIRKSNPGGGRDFPHSSRPRGPHSLLYNWYWVSSLGVKWPGRGFDQPLKERIDLYFYSLSGPTWHVVGWNLYSIRI